MEFQNRGQNFLLEELQNFRGLIFPWEGAVFVGPFPSFSSLCSSYSFFFMRYNLKFFDKLNFSVHKMILKYI